MSLPRPVYPGAVYMITRRCVGRRFLLKPAKRHNQAWLYCLAWAAQRTGVRILWTTVMSNHHHTGVHDPEGNISEFCRELHRLVAKHHNASFGRFEYFWAPGPPSRVRLVDPNDVLDKLLYSLSNPVTAHLVERASQWPGVNTSPKTLCTRTSVSRPKSYFRSDGTMPDTLELEFARPPGFEHLSDREFRNLVADRLRAREEEAALHRRRKGIELLGRRAIRKQHHEDSPASYEKRFKLNPQVAAKDKWRRIEALQRLKAFVVQYREALSRWRAGQRDVEFPFGTNALRRLYGVRCRSAPA